MSLSFLLSEEKTGRFNYVLGTYLTPADLFRVAACSHTDCFAVDNQEALLEVIVYSAVEATVHCVVFQHVCHVVNGQEVVDGYYFEILSFCRGAEHETSDTAEAVNTDFSHFLLIVLGWSEGLSSLCVR